MADIDTIGAVIAILGIAIAFFGGLWFLVAAFRESIWWGLACLFIPIVSLFFLVVHWPQARKPFLLQLLGIVIIAVAIIVSPHTPHR